QQTVPSVILCLQLKNGGSLMRHVEPCLSSVTALVTGPKSLLVHNLTTRHAYNKPVVFGSAKVLPRHVKIRGLCNSAIVCRTITLHKVTPCRFPTFPTVEVKRRSYRVCPRIIEPTGHTAQPAAGRV